MRCCPHGELRKTEGFTTRQYENYTTVSTLDNGRTCRSNQKQSWCNHSKATKKLKDRITPHVTNFFRLRLIIEKQEGKRKYKSDGAVMVGEFVCMYVCSCIVSE